MNGTVYSSPPVSAGDTFQDQPRIVANPIQVNFRSTKVDEGKLKRKYLNRPWSTLAVNALIFSVRSKPRITNPRIRGFYFILNGTAQDEAEPKLVRSLAGSMVPGRMDSFSALSKLLGSRACAKHHSRIYSRQ
jgi:hypothetical protein